MSVYHGEEGIKQFLYDERKAFVDRMWQQYKQTQDKNGERGDYRLLAEICEALPFFENTEVGHEISRLLNKYYKGESDYYKAAAHRRKINQILRMWDDFKKDDTGDTYDNLEVRKLISKVLGDGWDEERIRDVIRQRDRALGQTD